MWKRDEVTNPFRVDRSMMGCQDPEACKNPETVALVLLPPSEEGFEAPGLRRLP